jgi:hypothetical protein
MLSSTTHFRSFVRSSVCLSVRWVFPSNHPASSEGFHFFRSENLRPSIDAVENEVRFVLEFFLYNPIRDKVSSVFENIVRGWFESFFQLDHQVDISCDLTEVTESATLEN